MLPVRFILKYLFAIQIFFLSACSDYPIQSKSTINNDSFSADNHYDLSAVYDPFYQFALTQTKIIKSNESIDLYDNQSNNGLIKDPLESESINTYTFKVCYALQGVKFKDNPSCVFAYRDTLGKPINISNLLVVKSQFDVNEIKFSQFNGVLKGIFNVAAVNGSILTAVHTVAGKNSFPVLKVIVGAASLLVFSYLIFNSPEMVTNFVNSSISKYKSKSGTQNLDTYSDNIENLYHIKSKYSTEFFPVIWGFDNSNIAHSFFDILSDDNTLQSSSNYSSSFARIVDIIPTFADIIYKIKWLNKGEISIHCLPFYSKKTQNYYSGCISIDKKWNSGSSVFYSLDHFINNNQSKVTFFKKGTYQIVSYDEIF